jgi:pyruvate/2-oxoglutarate dehydrogenase complex dihydrolipoamide acyltransferase (E2) component
MKYSILVPRTSDGALKVTIVRWIKNIGDDVRKGDDLVEANTEKITIYVSVPETGKLSEIIAPVGQLVDVGEVIGYVEG